MAVKQIQYSLCGAQSDSSIQNAQALQRELGCLEGLNHPNIVRYLGVERDDVKVCGWGAMDDYVRVCEGVWTTAIAPVSVVTITRTLSSPSLPLLSIVISVFTAP